MAIFEQVAIGLLTALIGVAIGRTWEKVTLLRKFGYVRALLSHRNIAQIIVSNAEIARFRPIATGSKDFQVQVPRNILYMPMPEGRAIAQLMSLLHEVSPRLKIRLVTAGNYDPEVPTFSIGGPSVNAFTAKTLSIDFPDFSIYYPATKKARYQGHTFETLRDTDGSLTRDYGFIFLTRTTKGAPCMIFCGVRAFGTAMAVDLFSALPGRSDAARLLRRSHKAFIAADGEVAGLEPSSVKLCFCRELPAGTATASRRTLMSHNW